MVTPDSERTMHTFLGITAELSPQELDLEALNKARYLYIEGYLATLGYGTSCRCFGTGFSQITRH
jgi:sugar/nucleoside kinase (ribokinase family)